MLRCPILGDCCPFLSILLFDLAMSPPTDPSEKSTYTTSSLDGRVEDATVVVEVRLATDQGVGREAAVGDVRAMGQEEDANRKRPRLAGDNSDHSSGKPDVSSASPSQEQDDKSEDGDEQEQESHGSDNDDETSSSEGPHIDLDHMDDDTLLQILRNAASARGISFEYLLQTAAMQEDDDDEDVEYPFGSRPDNLKQVAEFIKSDKCRRIVVLAGAGMSVNSGIPDYRSADGFYATLQAEKLTANPIEREAIRADPTAALEQQMFLQNPLPCLELKRDFILGTYTRRWKATLAHRFVEMLHHKTNKVVRWYTQNIDGLEDQCTNIPRDKVITVHGSMDRAECASCGTESDYDKFCQAVQSQIKDLSEEDAKAPSTSRPIVCDSCGKGSMKPAIVLFRSSLPRIFFDSVPNDVEDIDLLIVMGTSLQVAPANSLVWRVPKSCLRLLMNREPAGRQLGMNFEDGRRDYHAEGDCDDIALELMEHLGWLDEMQPLASSGELPPKCVEKLSARLKNLKVEESSNPQTPKDAEDQNNTAESCEHGDTKISAKEVKS